MKKIVVLIIIAFAGKVTANAQTQVLPFFQKLFIDLKKKDSADFNKNSLSGQQYERLVRIGSPELTDTSAGWIRLTRFVNLFYHEAISQRFQRLIYQADSLGIDLKKADYVDCKFEQADDPIAYYRSARGIIHFKIEGSDYEWVITEAIWIDDEWKILNTGEIGKGTIVGFPSAKANKISAYGSFGKLRVTHVVLAPPPPIDDVPPPPPLSSKH